MQTSCGLPAVPGKKTEASVKLRRLFDRFYRADESREKSGHGGYGIGLAIASAVAEKHGGRMEAKMQEGRLLIRCLLPAAG